MIASGDSSVSSNFSLICDQFIRSRRAKELSARGYVGLAATHGVLLGRRMLREILGVQLCGAAELKLKVLLSFLPTQLYTMSGPTATLQFPSSHVGGVKSSTFPTYVPSPLPHSRTGFDRTITVVSSSTTSSPPQPAERPCQSLRVLASSAKN